MLVLPDTELIPKQAEESVISLAKYVLNKNQIICIINDYDDTISDPQYGKGNDPFHTRIFPQTAKALSSLESKGVVIGAVSNRSGGQISRRYNQQGILRPFIIGTYGLELYKPNPQDPSTGQIIIDQRYLLYGNRINEISNKIMNSFLKIVGNQNINFLVEMTIPTKLGIIYLENKALSTDFPLGISHVFNLNSINLENRSLLVDKLRKSYIDALSVWEDSSITGLREIWGEKEFGKITDQTYSWSLSPLIKEGKLLGVTKLLNTMESSEMIQKQIGLVIYSGDEDADAEAMIGLREITKISTRGENEKLNIVGIWVNPGEERAEVKNASDLEVDGVEGYANFLTKLNQSI